MTTKSIELLKNIEIGGEWQNGFQYQWWRVTAFEKAGKFYVWLCGSGTKLYSRCVWTNISKEEFNTVDEANSAHKKLSVMCNNKFLPMVVCWVEDFEKNKQKNINEENIRLKIREEIDEELYQQQEREKNYRPVGRGNSGNYYW